MACGGLPQDPPHAILLQVRGNQEPQTTNDERQTVVWRGTQVAKGEVCKTSIRRFDSAPRLHRTIGNFFPPGAGNLGLCCGVYPGEVGEVAELRPHTA